MWQSLVDASSNKFLNDINFILDSHTGKKFLSGEYDGHLGEFHYLHASPLKYPIIHKNPSSTKNLSKSQGTPPKIALHFWFQFLSKSYHHFTFYLHFNGNLYKRFNEKDEWEPLQKIQRER